jgi:hypothetical protein
MPDIEIVDYETSLSVPGQWKLRVLWHFANRDDKVLYVLVADPVPMVMGDHVILDHSAPDSPDERYFNVVPGFEFSALQPGDTTELWLGCNLELRDSVGTITVVGRFGNSYEPPDQNWVPTKNWMQVAKWQQRADAAPYPVRLVK